MDVLSVYYKTGVVMDARLHDDSWKWNNHHTMVFD